MCQFSLRILFCPGKKDTVVDEEEGYTFIFRFRHNFGLVFRSVPPVYGIKPTLLRE